MEDWTGEVVGKKSEDIDDEVLLHDLVEGRGKNGDELKEEVLETGVVGGEAQKVVLYSGEDITEVLAVVDLYITKSLFIILS